MKIFGSGGREHAIAFSTHNQKVKKIYCIPGNAGTSEICEMFILILINLKNPKF